MDTMRIKKSRDKDTWWIYDFDKDNKEDMERLNKMLKEEGRQGSLVQTTNRSVYYIAFK